MHRQSHQTHRMHRPHTNTHHFNCAAVINAHGSSFQSAGIGMMGCSGWQKNPRGEATANQNTTRQAQRAPTQCNPAVHACSCTTPIEPPAQPLRSTPPTIDQGQLHTEQRCVVAGCASAMPQRLHLSACVLHTLPRCNLLLC